MATKSKADIEARRAANNARIEAGNARKGKTAAQQSASNASARASMDAARSRVAQQKVAPAAPAVVAAPKAVVAKAPATVVAKPRAKRRAAEVPMKKAAPAVTSSTNMSSEVMSREVAKPKMVDKTYGIGRRTTPVRKSGWSWSS